MGLEGPFISCLCSQRPDDLEEVLGHFKHQCDRDALIPVVQPSLWRQCLYKLEKACHYCSSPSFFNLNGNCIPKTGRDLTFPSRVGLKTPIIVGLGAFGPSPGGHGRCAAGLREVSAYVCWGWTTESFSMFLHYYWESQVLTIFSSMHQNM